MQRETRGKVEGQIKEEVQHFLYVMTADPTAFLDPNKYRLQTRLLYVQTRSWIHITTVKIPR